MKFSSICNALALIAVVFLPRVSASDPLVLGKAEGRFEVGKLLAQDDFTDLSNWKVQIEKRGDENAAWVESRDGWLDCYLPGRGATIWFKEKLKTRVSIVYEVVCPQVSPGVKGMSPRDINNFWLASDPGGGSLFDEKRYTGKFSSYDKIHGYYASTGGGGAGSANRTVRLRRYPREVNGEHAAHLFLNDKDEQKDYLIRPDEVMTVQLVAYDDLIQYIVDGKVVYEAEYGDLAQMERLSSGGEKATFPTRYTKRHFPFYQEGYFGFRMVGTHHRYRNFRVYELQPPSPVEVSVSSVEELREAVKESNRHIRMTPGTYVIEDLENDANVVHFTGSNNEINLTDVKFEIPLEVIRKMRRSRGGEQAVLLLSGDRITLIGLKTENTYPNGKSKVTDFGSYNQQSELHPPHAIVELRANGDDIILRGLHMTVRGSSPYGYGNMYGIGGGAAMSLRKHSGILAKGNRPIIEDCYVKMEAFGHAIFFQGGDNILVRNCTVEGEIRRSDELYQEKDKDDLARKFNYQLQWPDSVKGLPIPRDHMINLAEDGIRAYPGARHVKVENCRVSKMRAGVKLYLARSAEVYDCVVTDCIVQGYSLPSKGKIVRCSGNAAYGPLLYIHTNSNNSQNIDLTVLPATETLGDHPLAAIRGTRNRVRFKASEGPEPVVLRPIIVGYQMRFDFLSVDFPKVPPGYEKHFAKHADEHYRAEENTIINETGHPVVLGDQSRDNAIESKGRVTDLGRNSH
ncbi:DUF6250 domain-containing protein [Roseibacillus persicicus]|uniref:DUF6250 domain-containing protein n=1 Tax=Roseibacillus persicicus TaxID=454148 RepID=A0A918TXF4_9BACT|nr:DUF6250 domain-containing protein [Roseibacillus persicicus]GHC60989.1 hypothetical protein GCM10007100_30310 [Roseibacillus persicicus]